MDTYPSHAAQIVALKRIEGQVRGLQKMIEEKKYCLDILNQTRAVAAALARVEEKVLEKHLQNCVAHAVEGKSIEVRQEKLQEVAQLIRRFRKSA